LDIRVTDQPARDVTAIVVTATLVEVNKVDGEDAPGWIAIVERETSFDLLKVAGIEEILGTAELEPGKYVQTRVHVGSVMVTLNGTEVEATVPSGIIRLVRPIEIEAGATTIATLDFDAQKSVIVAGPRVQFKPVVKLLVRKEGEAFQPSLPDAAAAPPSDGATATD
jgi:hypothetical protein